MNPNYKLVVLSISLFFALSVSISAAPGDLDPTFGTGGKLTTAFISTENAQAVAVQPDGKIVAAGYSGIGIYYNGTWTNTYNLDFAVFRYNPDGSLDTSFDADGKVTTDFANGFDSAYAVAIQPDGKIVAAGSSGANFALVRYNPDGSLDTSFGAGGKVITDIGQYGGIYEIAVQTDGKIVAVGGNFTIARYNSDGSLDASFGTGGIVRTSLSYNSGAHSVAIQADGKIVAAGDANACDIDNNCFSFFVLARYNTNGSLDTSFDGDGTLLTSFAQYSSAYAVVVQADGRIVAAGGAATCDTDNNCDYYSALARYNENGSLDPSFDGDGKVTLPFDEYGFASSVFLQSNGKIVVSGNAYGIGTGSDFSLVRLNADGSPDTSFDADGKLTTDFGGGDWASDVAVQADGKIVAAGGSNDNLALSRYNPGGSLDGAFDGDGKLTTSFPDVSSVATAVVVDDRQGYELETCVVGYVNNGANDDFALTTLGTRLAITPIGNSDDRANAAVRDSSSRIVAAGYSANGSNRDFALVRYHSWLEIDTSFDGDGKLTTDFGGNDEATAVAVQTDGKIVVAGRTSAGGGAALALARYNADGSLDASFGTGGKVIVQSIQNAKAMVIQPDGKILAAGSVPHTVAPFGDNFALARFHHDGSLDTTFDGDGIAATRFDFASQINALALHPYGKIVAAGFTRNNTGTVSRFALARYNMDGSLDTSFDADGKVTVSFSSDFSQVNAVGVQRNGKIVAAGNAPDNRGNHDFALARFNLNGSLDMSFGIEGKLTTDFFGGNDFANALAIRRDGRIIAAGSAQNGARTDFAAARYIGDSVKIKFDYDGDQRADLSFFNPNFNYWRIRESSSGSDYLINLSVPADKMVPADYDGDGRTDAAQYNSTTGMWYLQPSSGGDLITVRFGASGDIPAPSDYDGDGKTDVAVYRPSTGTWWILQSASLSVAIQRFGLAEDKPVAADYDGDGRSDIAVYRPSEGVWYLLQSTAGFTALRFGLAEDKPVASDYDGDGRDDIGVFRPGSNYWWIRRSADGSIFAVQFGAAGDKPAPADFDGDGKTDIVVFRPSTGIWYVMQSSSSAVIYPQFGWGSDLPTPSAFIQ